MEIRIPRLEEYGLSKKMGFLPDKEPLSRLTKKYYEPWEKIMDHYNDYVLMGRFRRIIDELPILSIEYLVSLKEKQRAYLILSFMAHSYVWIDKKPSDRLPASIAKPWIQVSEILEIRPIISYAAVCLWNWRHPFPNEPMNLSNLATLHTFSGTKDESWFYLISTFIEIEGAPCLQIILDTISAAYSKNRNIYIANMKKLSFYIEKITEILSRIYEKCDPYIFYWKIRPYLSGWKNMADAGLPKGVIYEGCSDDYRQYSGGSNGQSALIHLLDTALGVDHNPIGTLSYKTNTCNASVEKKCNFFQEMREYMPGSHRRFLEHLEKIINIRQFSLDNSNDFDVVSAYNACIINLKKLRDKHLQVVSRYIIIQSKNENFINMGLARHVNEKENLKGTGGTNLISFLKQFRNETTSCIIKSAIKPMSSLESCSNNRTIKMSLRNIFSEWNDNEWECIGGLCYV
ncbi:hypothetical protein T552_01330 [Pneumocystis carinii B80]|uniref:Indoleamine 2,3-dioxygenase n=1 Tax=Pneumocystis carinii (strain B80) TaxID=1408658 RepID=A0A0W4ZM00_PNEC8|nr:hypothetical protein T552_01330 [Pneumocystis carinii B80]KTW29376.1 hypothetical protein T552_01330 [Pneumocystis carinii B80]